MPLKSVKLKEAKAIVTSEVTMSAVTTVPGSSGVQQLNFQFSNHHIRSVSILSYTELILVNMNLHFILR